ncbi:MAG: hypothetical protein ACLPVY_14270 [Acidimicrobiia bacterium]
MTNCVAVGSSGSSTNQEFKSLVEQWNGSHWSIVASPNAGGAPDNDLLGVSCTSTTNCVAVGRAGFDVGSDRPLTMRWDGTRWTIVASRVPSDAAQSDLSAVSCTSANSCYALGGSSVTAYRALIERWNGTRWSILTSPEASGGDYRLLSAVSCTSAANCTVVGAAYHYTPDVFKTLVERWNGTAWTTVASPNPTNANYSALAGVSCTTTTDCTAVGEFDVSRPATLTEHSNGTAWTLIASPSTGPSGTTLNSVACTSVTNCIAVGNLLGDRTLAERYS